MLKEFKEFALKGNMLDLAIALILGTAFGRIVASLVTDVLMPPIGMLLGRVDFANLFINLSDKPYATLAEARAAGAATIAFGVFLNNVINFLIVALVLFLFIRQVNRIMPTHGTGSAEDEKELAEKAKEQLEERAKEAERGAKPEGSENGTASEPAE